MAVEDVVQIFKRVSHGFCLLDLYKRPGRALELFPAHLLACRERYKASDIEASGRNGMPQDLLQAAGNRPLVAPHLLSGGVEGHDIAVLPEIDVCDHSS